ncbi:type II secretion system F family protein [Niveibacterium umoris]|uniref:General secretion pathway protein F n=1 Tax=Niveibacterium umoris TaxID=1193620 RepID=A0A840BJS6_9RHOO|nr:type II secretion system F family protein [Niveibacterium umoris]MBB4010807.1 general secretion pathway protein F [Niveibacterium umoris]
MKFTVKALANGAIQQLEIEAADRRDLERMLSARGLSLVSAESRLGLSFKRPQFSLSLFTQELIALLTAGLSLVESVDTLRQKSDDPLTQQVLGDVLDALQQGKPLSVAMAQQSQHFPELYIATVSSSERTGHLADALRRYHHYDTRLAALRKKIVSALIYPMVIVTIGGGILLFLLFYVIPKFSAIYENMRHLPFAAQLMLEWGRIVAAHGNKIGLGIAMTIAGAIWALRTPAIRNLLLEHFWRLPRLSEYRRLFALARFYRTLSLLLAGGLPVVAAMRLTEPLLPDAMRINLARAREELRSGQPLSTVLSRHHLTTPVAERLLRVSEQSGELAQMSERIAVFCDEELDKAIDLLTRLFEPVLMLCVGTLIGVIVFLLYMPIFELAGNMQ